MLNIFAYVKGKKYAEGSPVQIWFISSMFLKQVRADSGLEGLNGISCDFGWGTKFQITTPAGKESW